MRGGRMAAALTAADVVFLPETLAMAHTVPWARRPNVSMTTFTERMMHERALFIDFDGTVDFRNRME